MNHNDWLQQEAARSLKRLRPRIDSMLYQDPDARLFRQRLDREFPRLFGLLFELYGKRYDFFYHLIHIMETATQMFRDRDRELRYLDQRREQTPDWFLSEKMVGAVCYVDLFAGTIQNLHDKIPYFKELGVTYLHLMPLFKAPEDNSDGGYAVSDYRTINPDLGTMADLAAFAAALRAEGISLVLDFVFNHTSDEHEWAQRALAGDSTYREYYHFFPDRTIPDQYERTLREIFPEQAPGSFTYLPEIDHYVWTSFYNFQWDLNYHNPDVFNAMMGEMLFLANQGVEVLRLDAVAFIWKQMGTSCENLPQAHMIIQAYNALVKIVAPAMVFKSEAIVHPDDVMSYIGTDECPISYNPTLMALIWESLATRKVNLLQRAMSRRYALPEHTAWVNYVRVHDDIGWTFADEDAAELWINGYDHRQFLNQFYIGAFEGSFAKGMGFGYNPINRDMRICGTAASLAGLEQAIEQEDSQLIEMAIRRILLMHSIILSTGGIPLIYIGDEIGSLNDYSFLDDPDKNDDNRWVHRQTFKERRAALRHDPETIPGRIFTGLVNMIAIRKEHPVFGAGSTTFFDTGNQHVFGYIRRGRLLCLTNVSDFEQTVSRDLLAAYVPVHQTAQELLTGTAITLPETINLPPLSFRWLLFDSPAD